MKLADVRLLVLDVDGVLTDGTLVYGPDGEQHKPFFVRDGLGVVRLRERGVEVAIVTGRGNEALAARARELGIERVVTGCRDKWAAVETILRELSLTPAQLACVGDDVTDLPVIRRAAAGIAVADAHPDVEREAAWVTRARGGRGAVREVADAICAALDGGAFRVVIPARYAATRLPGKPLRLLAGRPMIAHVWDRATESGARDVVVAADDDRILAAVADFGGRAVATSPDCASGTDRLAEVARREGWAADEVVVNLQGDEPLISGALVRAVADAVRQHPEAGIATLATPIIKVNDVFDPNVVKVVVDQQGMASYFSRAPIPWARGVFGAAQRPAALPGDVTFLRHLGLYAYRVGVLTRVAAAPPAPAERAESLEQLRALALGIGIHVTVVSEAPGHGVDTAEDLARVERLLTQRA